MTWDFVCTLSTMSHLIVIPYYRVTVKKQPITSLPQNGKDYVLYQDLTLLIVLPENNYFKRQPGIFQATARHLRSVAIEIMLCIHMIKFGAQYYFHLYEFGVPSQKS